MSPLLSFCGGVVCTVICMSNPSTMLRLCCCRLGFDNYLEWETHINYDYYPLSNSKLPTVSLWLVLYSCIYYENMPYYKSSSLLQFQIFHLIGQDLHSGHSLLLLGTDIRDYHACYIRKIYMNHNTEMGKFSNNSI